MNYFSKPLAQLFSSSTKKQVAKPAPKKISRYKQFHTQGMYIKVDDGVIYSSGGKPIKLAKPAGKTHFNILEHGYDAWFARKYQLEDFVFLEPHDVVVESGAYVGGFTRVAASKAKAVYSFEPNPHSYRCLQENTRLFNNVTLYNEALGNVAGTLDFKLGVNPVESSLIDVDDGRIEDIIKVNVQNAAQFCQQNNITPTFFKVEAEGFEPEIVEGALSLPVKKFAVDCSPERGGESPAPQITQMLESAGFECRLRGGRILFARRP